MQEILSAGDGDRAAEFPHVRAEAVKAHHALQGRQIVRQAGEIGTAQEPARFGDEGEAVPVPDAAKKHPSRVIESEHTHVLRPAAVETACLFPCETEQEMREHALYPASGIAAAGNPVQKGGKRERFACSRQYAVFHALIDAMNLA